MDFLEQIINRAKSDKKTIVLPESTDIRTIQAAAMIQQRNIADIVLLGEEKEILDLAGEQDISKVMIQNHLSSEKFNPYAEALYELRKTKGWSMEKAQEVLKNPLYYAAMMIKMGEADGMVAGAVNATSDVILPAVRILKGETDKVSSFFLMVVPNCEYGHHGVFIYADSGVIPNPTPSELADIAIASAESFRLLVNAEPKVAMLSYSTYGSAKSELTEKVIEATRIAKEKAPGLIVDGELQVDAAIVPEVSSKKASESCVAGQANVLIFPDLNSANISYKLTERLARAEAYGPIMQGLLKPVNDLSRGCSAEDIVGVVAITAVQAQIASRR